MMNNDIAIVISYCSNDSRFIETCIDQALLCSNEIIIPVSDHLFSGESENIESINQLAKKYPKVNFFIYQWSSGKHPRYWHNMSRLIGSSLVSHNKKWVLFIDSDEIIESELFNKFTTNDKFNNFDSYKLACYWYFRDPIYQSKIFENSPVLVKKEYINIDIENLESEREQLCEHLNVVKQINVTQDEKPMIHHFSWVRTKEQMLSKVINWGHSSDKNWIELIEEEFSRPFNGTDFVHGYQYTIVENKFNI